MNRNLRIIVIVTAISALIGGLIGIVQSQEALVRGIVTGVLTGAGIAAGCLVVELGVLSNGALRAVRRLPPLALVALRGLSYSAVILFGMALPALVLGGPWPWTSPGFDAQFALSCAIAALFSIGVEVVRFLGQEASLSLISVRYAVPRLEDRVVMFADLAGSTALGEDLGAVQFHSFLREVAADLSQPIARARGQVHRYAGDAVIVTWPRGAGVRQAACLDCARAMHAALAAQAGHYERSYRHTPQIRIALHVGEVAAGEMGAWKKEIALLGDVMNTTARIEAAAKAHGAATVLSGDLVAALPEAARAKLTPLPALTLDGKAQDNSLWHDA
ncbi:MAG: adenylate/guanylate cyclase domain-containing protein [Pseudomonadota bacterium]